MKVNVYRKQNPVQRWTALSAREAVAKYGDDWRLLGNTRYAWADRMTIDDKEAADMRMMERGDKGRVRPDPP